MKKSKLLLFSCCLLVLAFSCRKEVGLKDFDSKVSIPLANTSLSLENFLESENYETDEDGAVNLAYNLELYSSNPIDELTIPDRRDTHYVSLESIQLSNTALKSEITLGDAYPLSKLIAGQRIQLQSLTIYDAANLPVDANTFFESAELKSGKMYVKITNGFPVEIEYMNFRLLNNSNKSLVANMELFNVKPGETAIDSADMKDKFAEGNMIGQLAEVRTKASDGEVLIDPNDAVKVEVSVKNLEAYEATAVFPAQDLINHDVTFEYDFKGAELVEMKIKEGILEVTATSTIDETIYVTYEIPGVTDDDGIAVQKFTVPPSSSAKPYTETKVVNLEGYNVILRGKESEGWMEVNNVHNRLVARIDSTGELKTISQDDYIELRITLKELVPEYVLGYLGQETISAGPSQTRLEAFTRFDGYMELSKASMALNIENNSGVDASIAFKQIAASDQNNKVVILESPELAKGLEIEAAKDRQNSVSSKMELNEENSNAREFIELLPRSILYGFDVFTNPGGNDNNWSDFAYSDSKIGASATINIPMTIKPENMALGDTIDLSLEEFSQIEGLKKFNLHVILYNGYPFDVDLDMILLDENGVTVETLFSDTTYAPAGLKKNFSEKINEPSKGVFTAPMSKEKLETLSTVTKAMIKVRFSSSSETPETIYDSYKMDIKLTGDIEYAQDID